MAQWTRYVQAGLAEALGEDYVRTGRGKGVAERALVLRHALPNAAIPLLTVIGLEVPRLLAGAMVTEVVFAWPGLGRLLTASLLGRDYPVAMGSLMLLAVAVVAANLAHRPRLPARRSARPADGDARVTARRASADTARRSARAACLGILALAALAAPWLAPRPPEAVDPRAILRGRPAPRAGSGPTTSVATC